MSTRFPRLHAWDVTPREARAIQESLRPLVESEDRLGEVRRVAGVDIGFEDGGTVTRAAVAVLAFPSLTLIEHTVVRQPTRFPYVPGLLSFREAPAALEALARLSQLPDLVLYDGQGLAHPRRLGIACHIGIITDLPSIGVAKTRLIGHHEEPGMERGPGYPSWTETKSSARPYGPGPARSPSTSPSATACPWSRRSDGPWPAPGAFACPKPPGTHTHSPPPETVRSQKPPIICTASRKSAEIRFRPGFSCRYQPSDRVLPGTGMKFWKVLGLLGMAALGSVTAQALAAEFGGMEFTGTGFLSATTGVMLGGSRGPVNDRSCPCFISDYAQNSVYDGRSGVQWKPDSRLGLQGSAYLDHRRFSMTTQVVTRIQDSELDLQWLYASYVLDDHWTVQAGRKRLPLFYYSDVQDVGFALPWTHLPPQVYGWEVVNYNGISLTHQDDWHDWNSTLHLLAGLENSRGSDYWKIYRGTQNRTDVKWQDILGGYLSLSHSWFETRVTYIQSKVQRKNVTGSWSNALQAYDPATAQPDFGPTTRQNIFGVAVRVNHDDWLLHTEFVRISRPGEDFKDFAQLVSLGRRMGKWQGLLTWSNYREAPLIARPNEAHTDRSLTLRYDLTNSSDIKLQLDSQKDNALTSYQPRYGDSRLLTLSYDRVF